MTPVPSSPKTPRFADAFILPNAWKRLVVPGKLNRIYSGIGAGGSDPQRFAGEVLQCLRVRYSVSEADMARIPRNGPVVVVCNHPFGVLEGLILIDMLSGIRPDLKILANSMLARIPEMREALILVDPFGSTESKRANSRGVRETLSFLRGGGLLIVFPAGEVSHLQLRQRRIADPGWNENIARFIRHGSATVVPLFIKGSNSLTFQLMGMIHSQLRTARLLHELANKEEKTIELRVATPIDPSTIRSLGDDCEVTRYLRYRTYLLENRGSRMKLLRPSKLVRRSEQIAEAIAVTALADEVSRLDPLTECGDLIVYRARATEIPNVLLEIGRLREITFRGVGEGTGKMRDLDRFDAHYHHLFLWNRQKRELVGAYRLGVTAEILPVHGLSGLYTSTLFHFDERFLQRVGPAIEMGRSFVRPEYQRQYGALLALWKGIGAHVCRSPEHPILFGPVSISNDYNPVSRRLIVRYLQAQESMQDLSALVHPYRKFKTSLRGSDNEAVSLMLRDSAELSAVTADIETDGKGIPILLKQYLKVGGKLLGFSVDPVFANALDGLILVDLRQTAPAVLHRYMGREGTARFQRYHQIAVPCASRLTN